MSATKSRCSQQMLTATFVANSLAHSRQMRWRAESSAGGRAWPWATMREFYPNRRYLPQRAYACETAGRLPLRRFAPRLRDATLYNPIPASRTQLDTREAPASTCTAMHPLGPYQPYRHTDVRLALEGRSKSRIRGSLAASLLIVSKSTSMQISSSRFVQRSKHEGLATPQPLLQSAAMSVMRHTARTGSSGPQVSNEPAGRQFRIWWIQNPRP